MLIERYPSEDVFARVPELANQTDPVLVQLDHLLDDDQLSQRVRGDLAQRYRLTRVHGRHATPAEVILRLLVVPPLYAWSYQETVERVADSLVLRWFSRVSFRRVPDQTTLLRWAQTIRPATLQALADRAALLAKQAHVTRARKLRIASTCVQTLIHPPTASSLLGDGVRGLTRLLQRAKPLVQASLCTVRDAFRSRLRTVRRLLRQVHRISRVQGEAAAQQQRRLSARLLKTTQQTVRQAERVQGALQEALTASQDVAWGDTSGETAAEPSLHRRAAGLQSRLARFLPLVRRVMTQASSRVLEGKQVPATEQGLSLFEPHTRVVKRAKAGAPVEFGRQVVLDEVQGGSVTRFHVLSDAEAACHQAVPAGQQHQAIFARPPWLVTGDRRLHTKGVEAAAQGMGVRQVVIPRAGTLSLAQRDRERQRNWRRRYRWAIAGLSLAGGD